MSETYPDQERSPLHPERTLPVGASRPLAETEHGQITQNLLDAFALPEAPTTRFHFHAALNGT